MKNNIYIENFGSLEEELLKIDYVRFCFNRYFSSDHVRGLAIYLESLGFRCYEKDRDSSKYRTPLGLSNKTQKFQATFIWQTTYQKSTHLEFAGESASHLYSLMKTEKLNWAPLEAYGASLKRIDTCYDHSTILKPKQRVSTSEFIDATIKQFLIGLPETNISYRNNQKGQIASVGYRGSRGKYYRIYEKNNGVRFELEYKHPKHLKVYQGLLQTNQFQLFERHLSFQFFNQTYLLFYQSRDPELVVWMAKRLRPLRTQHHSNDFGMTILVNYLKSSPMDHSNKVTMVLLFQLFAYLRSLENKYSTGNLTSKFRKYNFAVADFVKFSRNQAKADKAPHEKVTEAKDFIQDILRKNLLLEFFSSRSYRTLVTIPEASATKVQNQWMAEVWIADELFAYLEPFLFSDDFKNLNFSSHKFLVFFEIIQKYSVDNLRKEFDVPKFLESQPQITSGKRQNDIKKLFVNYLQQLYRDEKIQKQIVFPLLGETNPKREIEIVDLDYTHLNQPFIIFELLGVNFVKPKIRDC